MPVFKRDREEQQQNSRERVVSEAKKRIYKQAGLALTAILVTVALLFAMSTAWYSNVLEAGSLTFQAEKWELNADHVSSNGNVVAQPGARGILPVSYKNTSDSIVNAYVNVSKEQMDVPLQKRIYFYTETPYTVERKAKERATRKLLPAVISPTARQRPIPSSAWGSLPCPMTFAPSIPPSAGNGSTTF